MAPTLAAGVRILPDASDLLAPHTTLAAFTLTAGGTDATNLPAGLPPVIGTNPLSAMTAPLDQSSSGRDPITAALNPVLGSDLVPLPLSALVADENVNGFSNPGITTGVSQAGAYVFANTDASGSSLAASNAIFSAHAQSLWFNHVPSNGAGSALTLGDAANLHVDISGNLLGTVS
jgi:hypothetical protein